MFDFTDGIYRGHRRNRAGDGFDIVGKYHIEVLEGRNKDGSPRIKVDGRRAKVYSHSSGTYRSGQTVQPAALIYIDNNTRVSADPQFIL